MYDGQTARGTFAMEKHSLPDCLAGYHVLHEEGTFVVFENLKLKPFDDWTEDYAVLVYDRDAGALLACANWKDDQSLEGEVLLGQGVAFLAGDVKRMVAEISKIEKWLLE